MKLFIIKKQKEKIYTIVISLSLVDLLFTHKRRTSTVSVYLVLYVNKRINHICDVNNKESKVSENVLIY